MGHATAPPVKDTFAGMLAVFFTAFFLLPALAASIAGAVGSGNPVAQNALNMLCQQALFGLLALWHLRVNLRLSWPEFGIRAITPSLAGKAVLAGMALVAVNGAGVWLGRLLTAALMGPTRAAALFNKEMAALMGAFRQSETASALFLLFLVVAIAAPLAEELLFRGYLYAALKSKIGRHAIWASSLIFTIAHMYVAHAVAVFLLALALTWLYEKHGVLWVSILAHAALNSSVAIILLAQRP